MIQKLLKHSIRKEILKGNKKINHKAFTQSMSFGQKVPHLLKYHKKKVIFGIVMGLIIWTYDLQKSIYRKIVTMRSPITFIASMFIPIRQPEPTVLQLNTAGVSLSENTIHVLEKFYAMADKELIFGVGRNYMFEICQQLGLLEKVEDQRKFWLAAGFYKERNQKASGVGYLEYLNLFEQSLRQYRKKVNSSATEQQFLNRFIQLFIQKAPLIKQWQKEFNRERQEEYIKNQPSQNSKKQDMILQLLKEQPEMTIQEVEKRIRGFGMRGMNLQDQFLFWQIRRCWFEMKSYNIWKKMSHPVISSEEKYILEKEKKKNDEKISEVHVTIQKVLDKYKLFYKQDLLSMQ